LRHSRGSALGPFGPSCKRTIGRCQRCDPRQAGREPSQCEAAVNFPRGRGSCARGTLQVG
jgi:hypothetical protein